MKNLSKKILSILLMTGVFLSTLVLGLPTSTARAATVSATASPLEQSGTPGSTVSFAITLTNEEGTSIDVELAVNSARGNTNPSVAGYTPGDTIEIAANSSKTVMVDVELTPAVAGENDIVTLVVSNIPDGYITQISMTVNIEAKGASVSRPLVVLNSYSTGSSIPKAGSEFPLSFTLYNRGQNSAFNLIVTLEGEGFFPRGTGGVLSQQNLEPGAKITFTQNFLVGDALTWSTAGTIKATATYMDNKGVSYTDVFTLTISLTSPSFMASTSTPNASLRPQIVIISNSTDIDPLQPGSIFELTLDAKNLGLTDAKSVIMVLGGGVTTNEAGTPQPGASGSGADLTNFAPLGSSNIVVVGDISQGASIPIKLRLVVNVTTVPGAYTLKTSFIYTDSSGARFVDDQVITLLVYSLPQVEISFYMDPGMLTAGMPGMLPLQVTNLGKKTSVLGNMKVTSTGGDITNNVALVGALDPGGYFTLDSEIFPYAEGPVEILVTINYTDDFNQPREISQNLILEAMPEMIFTPEPGMGEDGMPLEPVAETFWSKVLRFFKGLLGLDSAVKEPVGPGGFEEKPIEEPAGPVISGPKG